MITKADVIAKITNNILLKTVQDQITPQGVADILNDILTLIPDSLTTLSGNILTLPDGQTIPIEQDTAATINSGIITFADGQTYNLGTIDTDTFATIQNGVITTPDGIQHPYSSEDTFALFDGNSTITFSNGDTLTLSEFETTASNGLTKIGNDIQLRGDLIDYNEIGAAIDDDATLSIVFKFDPNLYRWEFNGDFIQATQLRFNLNTIGQGITLTSGRELRLSSVTNTEISSNQSLSITAAEQANLIAETIFINADTEATLSSSDVNISADSKLKITAPNSTGDNSQDGYVLSKKNLDDEVEWIPSTSGLQESDFNSIKHIIREDICVEGEQGLTNIGSSGFFDINQSLLPSNTQHLFIQQFRYQGVVYNNSTHPQWFPDSNNGSISTILSNHPNAAYLQNTGDLFGKDFCVFLDKLIDLVEHITETVQDRSKWMHFNNLIYFPNNDPNFQPITGDIFSWRTVVSSTGTFVGQAARDFNGNVSSANVQNCIFLPKKAIRETSIDFEDNETVIYKDLEGSVINNAVETECYLKLEDIDQDTVIYTYRVGALPTPEIDPHFHFAYLRKSHIKSLVIDQVQSVTITSDVSDGHSHDLEIQYDLINNKFIVVNISSTTDHQHTAYIVGLEPFVGPSIQKSTSNFIVSSFDNNPITLIPSPGQDKVIFVDKIHVSLKNYDGFNTNSAFSEFKVGQLNVGNLEVFLDFGGDQKEHFIVQSSSSQTVRKSQVVNQPLTWTINPTNESGLDSVDVEFNVSVYYTIDDVLDDSNLPS